MTPEDELIEDIAGFSHDPLGHAYYAFPWGAEKHPDGSTNPLANHKGPREWQEDILSVIGTHLQTPETRYQPCCIAVASGHGIGKGHPVDMDYHGLPWGQYQTGDCIWGANGDLVVIKATRYYKRQHYLVTFDDGSSVEVSGEHLWKVKGRQQRRHGLDFVVKDTHAIIQDYLRPNGAAMARQYEIPIQKPLKYTSPSYFKTDPYTYGAWLGDGDKSTGRITNIDSEVWDNIPYETKANCITRTPYGLISSLKRDGLFGCTTYTASIDPAYKYSNKRIEVLQGLLDTDGWVEQCGSAAFASTSRQLTQDVVDIARSLGLKAREPKFRTNDHAGSWQTHITWNGEFDLFRIKRKQDKLIKAEPRYQKRWISNIEPTSVKHGMCVEVEGGLYLTPDCHVTHNSALIGMLTKWGLDTCDNTRIVCTSNTDTQLKSKTVPEVTKWVNSAITNDWFIPTATAIYSTQKSRQKSWRCDFVPWSKDNSEAFAGLHNEGKRIIVIFDEASGIDDKIWEVTEGALTDSNTEIIWIAFGNPTRNSGRFRECFRKYSKYWHTRNIDSRDVEGTNKEYFDRLVDQYGENSDVVKIRVKGQFPEMSARQLYNTADIDAARERHLRKEQYEFAPKVLACDPAWEGDDALIIGIRQGLYFRIVLEIAKNTNDIEIANKMARIEDEEDVDAVFIDGGYGTGIVSAGRTMGRNWQIVWFNGKSPREDCVNMRAAMYQNVGELLRDGLAIPNDQELYDEMVCVETMPTLDGKIKLPPKKDTKDILGRSPNKIDTLALTTAYPVVKKGASGIQSKAKENVKSYDPINSRINSSSSRGRMKR